MVFVKNFRDPSQSFNVMDFVDFCSGSTRSCTFFKLKQRMSILNSIKHFYFNRLPRLWNSLPSMDPNDPVSATKQKLRQCLWNHFVASFDPENPCSFHYVCPCRKFHFCLYQISLSFSIVRPYISFPVLSYIIDNVLYVVH